MDFLKLFSWSGLSEYKQSVAERPISRSTLQAVLVERLENRSRALTVVQNLED
jgi:hypothetical protein